MSGKTKIALRRWKRENLFQSFMLSKGALVYFFHNRTKNDILIEYIDGLIFFICVVINENLVFMSINRNEGKCTFRFIMTSKCFFSFLFLIMYEYFFLM